MPLIDCQIRVKNKQTNKQIPIYCLQKHNSDIRKQIGVKDRVKGQKKSKRTEKDSVR